ncbi:hypothetical protein HDU97_006939 [Phlyctochytrium planicorne]|nr:hypothetical protein HDU97_006939 [Phlyctochytrium planicorne]
MLAQLLLTISILASSLLVAPADAHFKVTTPPARFKSEALQVVPPCGGLPLSTRTPIPISGTFMEGVSYHPTAVVNFTLALTDSDPTEADFKVNWAKSPTTIPQPGNFQVPVEIANIQGVKVGGVGTLRISFDAGDGMLYQCVDVTFAAAANTNGKPNSAKTSNSMSFLLVTLSLFIAAIAL